MLLGLLDWSDVPSADKALQKALSTVHPHLRKSLSSFQSSRLSVAGTQPIRPLGVRSEINGANSNLLESWNGNISWALIDASTSDTREVFGVLDAKNEDPGSLARSIARRCSGDFALALWDAQQGELVLIRDAMGLRPLYYVRDKSRMAFASSLIALRAILPELDAISPVFIAQMLILDTEVGSRTAWRDLFSVPAGSQVILGRDQRPARIHRWWWPELDPEPPHPGEGTWPSALREKLLASVAHRLPEDPDAEIASFLSGGLDSSSIVGAMRAVTRDRGLQPQIHTLSFRFPDLQGRERYQTDESGYQDAVNDLVQGMPHIVRGDLLSPMHDLDDFLLAVGEPWGAPNRYLHHAGLVIAKQIGASVVFDGIDGDSAIGNGVERFEELARSLRWLQLVQEARMLVENSPAGRHSVARILREFALPGLQPAAWRLKREVVRGQQHLDSKLDLLAVGLRKRDDVQESLRARSRLPDKDPYDMVYRHASGLRRNIFDLATSQIQRLAMAMGIRVAFPFFDRELLELSLVTPLDQKLSHGWPRHILRQAVAGLVPEEVRWRNTKANLGAQFYRGLLTKDRPLALGLLNRSETALEPFVDIMKLRNATACFFEREDRSKAMPIFSVVTLARWLELRDEGAV